MKIRMKNVMISNDKVRVRHHVDWRLMLSDYKDKRGY